MGVRAGLLLLRLEAGFLRWWLFRINKLLHLVGNILQFEFGILP